MRGVLYREIRNNRLFKRIGLSIYSLIDYQEENKSDIKDSIRMHSYMEGICIELGNFNGFLTYTADPTAIYRENLHLREFATLDELPIFSYNEIVSNVKRIDVIWFNKIGYSFPQKVFEVVDSIGTINGAFNRSLQLKNFKTDFCIVAPEKYREKYLQTISMEVYQPQKDRFTFASYDDIIELYETTAKKTKLETKLFG